MERETRLARVVDQLRRRLEQQQAENEQLEDLLRQADTSLNGKVLHSAFWMPQERDAGSPWTLLPLAGSLE